MSKDYRYHGWAALALNEEILDYANDFETVDSWKHDRFQGEMYYICEITMYNQECIFKDEEDI